MKILVRVNPQAKTNEVIKLGERCFQVKTTKPAQDGRANQDVIRLLAEYFCVKKFSVEILSGHRSKEKIVEIDD